MLDGGGRVLVMYQAMQNARLSLQYFRGEPQPELLSRLLAAADELKACMIEPGELLRVSGGLPEKLRDIASIYACYCALCETEGLDGKDLITQAAAAADDAALFQGADLYIDDFAGLTKQEYALLGRLLSRARSCTAALLLGGDEKLLPSSIKRWGGCAAWLTARACSAAWRSCRRGYMKSRSLTAWSAAFFRLECSRMRATARLCSCLTRPTPRASASWLLH